jgi:tetratricopeptide (TPR) repeat protein
MNKIVEIIIISLVLVSTGYSADYIDKIKQGNEDYLNNNFNSALDAYSTAQSELLDVPDLDYNIAGVLHQLGDYANAIERYTKALNTIDINQEAKVHYNMGNTYFKMNEFQKAVTSYQNSLEINPDDMDAKYNLELARKMLKENTKPQDQDDKKKEEKEKQKKDEQDKKDQEQKNDEQKQKQDEQQKQQPQEQKEKEQQPDPNKMTKEDAERILNALKDDEQKQQKRVKREIKVGGYSDNDW